MSSQAVGSPEWAAERSLGIPWTRRGIRDAYLLSAREVAEEIAGMAEEEANRLDREAHHYRCSGKTFRHRAAGILRAHAAAIRAQFGEE